MNREDDLEGVFPENFLFGTANADHQVEAYDAAREDVWDMWERCQGLTKRKRGTDFWNRYREDIDLAAGLGCRLFRFSIAWVRVEPECGKFDPAAIAHYEKVVDYIRSKGMKVMVTLHHFVWPVWLERDYGGMIGKEFPDLFARYADRIAGAFGDRVDWWITFNEPSQLTFGYIKPWWQNRYYMPPGLPRGSLVDAEAQAVGKLVPNLFLAHARARAAIREYEEGAQVGVNPLVTGFPTWLQMLMDWSACHRGLAEALFKFTTKSALVSERGKVDLVIGGISRDEDLPFEMSDAYERTGKAVLVNRGYDGEGLESLSQKKVGLVGVGSQQGSWERYLPEDALKQVYRDYDEARGALDACQVDALYGDEALLMPVGLERGERFRFLVRNLSEEYYVALAAHGHTRLLGYVDRAIEALRRDGAGAVISKEEGHREARRPVSLHEVFGKMDSLPRRMAVGKGFRRVRRRGKIKVGIRKDVLGVSRGCAAEVFEVQLARQVAEELFGDKTKVEVVPIEPSECYQVLLSKTKWLNWAWRFWGTTSLIANANWWYLGMAGKLAPELCPKEAIGAQDFVGLDYYWGLPTWKLHQFRSLEDAARGRFLKAPVWPRGLYHALRRYSRWFPGQELFIVENGCTPFAGKTTRAQYMLAHLREVAKALRKGVPVRAYNWWSVTSNREWGHPFDPNTDFGLHFVDLDDDPGLERKATPEAKLFAEVIRRCGG